MLARYMLWSCVCLSVCLSVRPSVRLFVSSWNSTEMAKSRVTQTTPHHSRVTLVFCRQQSRRNSNEIIHKRDPYNTTQLTLGMLLHYLGKLRIQIFSRYSADGRKCKQVAILSPLTLLFHHKFWYFRCLKYRIFPILIATRIFHVTVLLLV